jgi:hypothetical protein
VERGRSLGRCLPQTKERLCRGEEHMTQEALKLAFQTLELSKETMESACKQIDELKLLLEKLLNETK